MRCPSCDSENHEPTKFCIECGAAFKRSCPKCGFDNLPQAKFCGDCGVTLATDRVQSLTIPHPIGPNLGAAEAQNEISTVAEGERKTVTALFADIKGSTELMADLDPEEARAIIDPALKAMIDGVRRYDGYVVQSTGDGIFALFGAPVAHEDHPQRAIYAALRLQEQLNAYSTRLREAGNVPIEARVGVNTGEVVVRSISTGAGQVEYTPIGHTTNLASRMQAVAPTGSIAINEETRKFVEGYFTLKALGPTRVKGVSEPVNVYEVTGLGPLRTRLQRSAGRGLTKFVGRKREMEAMKAAAARAWAGHGQIAAAIAEPGVGKSRLFFEFKVTSQAGWMVLETFSISHGKASSYLPVIDLLHGYFKIVTEDDARTRREKITGRVLALERTLEDALPYLFGLLGLIEGDDPLTGMDAQVRRRRTLDAIKRIILRESLNQPLMVIFEDLHWIDEDTQALLNLMVESIGNARVLLLVNFRPEYSHQWGSKTYYTQVNLDPLGPQSAEDLLAGLLGTDASLLPLERLIAEKTEGNPFFMEEIVQNLFEEGTLARNGAVKITRPLSGISIPTTVQAMLAARIDRLPPATKDLLQTLAVVGREFSASLVRVIIKRSTEELDRMLNDLQLAEFIYGQPAIGDIGYIFKHALTQEVAFNSILVDRRKLIHERIGQAIEFFFATNLADHFEDLAHHYSRSDNALKAVNYLYLASDQAFRRSHYGEAKEKSVAALKLLDKLSDRRERSEAELSLQLTLGRTAMAVKGYAAPEVADSFERAAILGREVKRVPETFSAIGGLYAFCLVRAEHHRAFEYANQLMELALKQASPSLRLDAHFALGTNMYWRGDFADSWKHLEQAFGDYQAGLRLTNIVASDTLAFALAYGASCNWHLGYPQKAYKLCADVLRRIREVDHPFTTATARLNLIITLLSLKKNVEARREIRELINISATSGFPYTEGLGHYFECWSILQEKPTEIAVRELSNILGLLQSQGAKGSLAYGSVVLGDANGKLKRPELGIKVIDQALFEIEGTGEYQAQAELYRVKGELLSLQSDPQAQTCLERAIEIARKQNAKSFELRATTSLAQLLTKKGRRHEARTMLAEIYIWFTEGFDSADLKAAKALLDELR